MSFEKKVIASVPCPRCNADAQLRIDIRSPVGDNVFIYWVCPKCRLKRYHSTTTKKAVAIEARIVKLREVLEKENPTSSRASAVRARIASLERQKNKFI